MPERAQNVKGEFGFQQEFLGKQENGTYKPLHFVAFHRLRLWLTHKTASPRELCKVETKSSSNMYFTSGLGSCSSPPLQDTAWDMRRPSRRCALVSAVGDGDGAQVTVMEPRSVPGDPCCPFPPRHAQAALTEPHHDPPGPDLDRWLQR